jgi:uncharacterized protein
MTGHAPALSPFIVKIASRCNLDCTYCYVYNQGDSSWRSRPAFMSEETFAAMVGRIREHCELSGQSSVSLVFHGGEPTLMRPARFAALCAFAREQLEDLVTVEFSIQTNGTRLDESWVQALIEHRVDVGISLDGPREVNDAARVDHRGRGSYDAVARGIARLREHDVPFGILSVVQLGADPLAIHRHFLELRPASIAYLLPSYTHDTVGPIRARYGPTPCADYLIPIFDEWWDKGTIDVTVREFRAMGKLIMGGNSELDSFGNPPLRFITVETDGSIHGLDKLRTCADGMTNTTLTVHDSRFADVATNNDLHAQIAAGMPLPTACRACPERDTCAGGYLPQRYSNEREFDNPSIWCADLLALFAHVRKRMGISASDTRARRAALAAV